MDKQQRRIQQAHLHLDEFFRDLSPYATEFGNNFRSSVIRGKRQLGDPGEFVKGFLQIFRDTATGESGTYPGPHGLALLARARSRPVTSLAYEAGMFIPVAGDPIRMAAEHLIRYLELLAPQRGGDPIVVRVIGMRFGPAPHGVCAGIGCDNLFLRKGGRKTCSAKCSRSRKDVKDRRNERMKVYLALKRKCERWGHVWPGKQPYNARSEASWEWAKHEPTVRAQEACKYCSVTLRSL